MFGIKVAVDGIPKKLFARGKDGTAYQHCRCQPCNKINCKQKVTYLKIKSEDQDICNISLIFLL